jgi:hypothetical protein
MKDDLTKSEISAYKEYKSMLTKYPLTFTIKSKYPKTLTIDGSSSMNEVARYFTEIINTEPKQMDCLDSLAQGRYKNEEAKAFLLRKKLMKALKDIKSKFNYE